MRRWQARAKVDTKARSKANKTEETTNEGEQ